MRSIAVAIAALLLVAAGGEPARIENLHAELDGSRVLLSFELLSAFDDHMRERLESGLPTELEYTLQLQRPRLWWFDKIFDRTTLQIVALYNAVTREYLVNTKLDGGLIDSRVVTGLAELERSMTTVRQLPAFELEKELHPRTQLMVRGELGSKHFLLLFSNRITTNWARVRMRDVGTVSP